MPPKSKKNPARPPRPRRGVASSSAATDPQPPVSDSPPPTRPKQTRKRARVVEEDSDDDEEEDEGGPDLELTATDGDGDVVMDASADKAEFTVKTVSTPKFHNTHTVDKLLKMITAAPDIKGSNRPSDEIAAALELAQVNYRKTILGLCLTGKITEKSAKTHLNEGTNTREKSDFNRFSSYGLEALALPMPKGGVSEGLVKRNKEAGALWRSYNDIKKLVFSEPYFLGLLEIPEIADDVDKEHDDNGVVSRETVTPTLQTISQEERDELLPIYHQLVDVAKVRANFDKISSSNSSISGAAARSAALKDFRKIGKEVARQSLRHGVPYYFLYGSSDSENPWAREQSSVNKLADWFNSKFRISAIFSLYAQGKPLVNAIEEAIPGATQRIRTTRQHSDIVKNDLTCALKALMVTVVGQTDNHTFPKTANPANSLASRKVPLKIVQKDGSTLSEISLVKGYRTMLNEEREAWLADIRAELFGLELIPAPPEIAITNTQ